jgi:hypothetical protein
MVAPLKNLYFGEMIKKIVILFLLLSPASMLWAQDAMINVWADQQVFIAGEDIWVDGLVQQTKSVSKTMNLLLLDRNGNKKAGAEVWMQDNGFSAYVHIPENLPSDYYFIDGYMNGLKSKTALFPVMIINPKIPPAAGCSFTSKNTNADASSINIFTEKEVYQPRNQVKVTLGGLINLSQTHLTVVRNDELNEIYNQAVAGFNTISAYDENTEKEEEGKSLIVHVRKNGKPVVGISVLAALKGSAATLAVATSNSDGQLKFLFPFKYNVTEVVLRSLNNDKDLSFELSSGRTAKAIGFPCLQLEEKNKAAIEIRMLHLNVTKSFYPDFGRQLINNTIDTTDFYGKPDARYYLDEYVRFPNMEEVIAEIIQEVRVKKEKDQSLLQILNIPFKFFFNDEGLILVDGIPFYNTNQLLESDPLQIKSIDVINRKYILGDHEFDGIVHFKTYRGDMGSLRLSESDKSFTIKGIQESTSVKPVVGDGSKLPDMRNIVLKKSRISSDFRGSATLQFTLSDAIGKYAIVLRGVDNQGNTVVSSKTIQVAH